MRRAGLVACANRKNRQPMPGVGTHREVERRDHHTRADVSGPCVGRAPRASSARQHQGDLIGTSNNGQGRAYWNAAKQRMVWDNAKVQRTEREEATSEGPMRRREEPNGRQRAALERSAAPAGCGAATAVRSVARGPLASRTHRQAVRNRSSWRTWGKGFRSTSAIVREVGTWETWRLVRLPRWRASHRRNEEANKIYDTDSPPPGPCFSMKTGSLSGPVSCSIMLRYYTFALVISQ